MIEGKKSQVTLFIIIGVLILLGVIVYINIQSPEDGLSFITETEEVPLEFQPVKAYVENCLYMKSKEGIKLIGDHGGYINPAEFSITSNIIDPTSSNGAAFPGSWVMPYWFYLKSDNKCIQDCEFGSERPYLKRNEGGKSIEAQLDSYVAEKVKDCTRGFEVFKQEGYEIGEGEIKVTTTVTENEVLFEMEYPLVVDKDGVRKDIKNFYSRIPVKLKEIYNLATTLTNLEQQYRYLERDAVQLIVGFSGVDRDKLPPMSEARWQFGSTVNWRKSQVKENIGRVLTSYIQLLGVQDTLNFQAFSFPGSPLKESLYNIHMLIPMEESYDGLAARFDYNNIWPIYFDLNCDGELCKPMSVSQSIIALIGMQRYEFAYDVSFPVMVEIFDPSAFNNEGYYFRYFLEANIRNNEVLRSDFFPLEPVDLMTQSMLCDSDKKNSGEITVNVFSADGDKVDDVQVVYNCIDESCSIGMTSDGVLKDKFPVCVGGILTVMKEGYLTNSVLLSTILDQEDSVDIALEPLLEKKFVVKKKKVVRSGDNWVFRPNELSIDKEENAIITLTRVGDLGDQDYSTIAEYKRSENIFAGEDSLITLAPGTYDINIQLHSDKILVIPEEKRETGGGLFGMGNEEYTIPEVVFDETWPSGGLTLRYEFKAEDLDKDRIVFFAVSPDLLGIPLNNRHIEDLEQMNKYEAYSYAFADSLGPRFE